MIRKRAVTMALYGVFLASVCWFALSSCSGPFREIVTPDSAPQPGPPGRGPAYEVFGEVYHPLQDAEGFTQVGIASWYGEEFHGRKTSTGETYDMHSMTAAHKILPFDTFVLVQNLETDKKIKVRINDRGPFVSGRIIDLSYGAARELGMVEQGTARVRVSALGKEKTVVEKGVIKTLYEPEVNYGIGSFSVQVGSFASLENAERLVSRLSASFGDAHVVTSDRYNPPLYQVRVSRMSTLEAARGKVEELKQMGFKDSFVVAE